MTTQPTQDELRRLVDREIYCCVSALVSTLAGHSYTEHGDLLELMEQAAELSSPIDDWEEATIQAGWCQRNGAWERDAAALGGHCAEVNSAQEACELDDIEPYQRDVYEHWSVSAWLADKLEARGEKVDRDFAGMNVWARTTTGQAILLDSVIEAIWRDLHADA